MKKLLIIMTLFMSSFFLFATKEVEAFEYNVELDFSLIPENLSSMINIVEDFVTSNETYSDNYLIYYSVRNKRHSVFFLPLDSDYQPLATLYSDHINTIFSNSIPLDYYNFLTNNTISKNGIFTYSQDRTYDAIRTAGYIPIYSNFDIVMKEDSSKSTITYTYDDYSVVDVADGVDTLNTLYDNYVLYQEYLENKELVHKEELEKVGSFYNIVIEKLVYLAETIVSNYIYLSIFVIFILIFVFLLIFRRFIC